MKTITYTPTNGRTRAFHRAMEHYNAPLERLDRLRAEAEADAAKGFGTESRFAHHLAAAYTEIIRRRYDAEQIAAHARRQRYLAVTARASRLACHDPRGKLILDVGGLASFYSRVEQKAWNKYIGR